MLTSGKTEWVKGLLAVPFVLYSQPTGVLGDDASVAKMVEESHRRYAEIMRDVEMMIDDHSMFRFHLRQAINKLVAPSSAVMN